MTTHRHWRVRTAFRGLALTALLWVVLIALAEWRGAVWPHRTVDFSTCFDRALLPHDPHAILTGAQVGAAFSPTLCKATSASDAWQNLILLAVIVEFLWLKSWMMGAMTRHWDKLGSSLIAANVAFSLIYVYAMGLTVFPHWAATEAADVRYPIRYGLILVLGWGIAQLLGVPDPEEEPETITIPREATAWERSALATERVASATEAIAARSGPGGAPVADALQAELARSRAEIARLKLKCGEVDPVEVAG